MVAYANPLTAKLLESRAKAAQARRQAFVDQPIMVCRFLLRPITLSTHNHLIATGNAFALPGRKLRPSDISGFIWLHHPEYQASDLRLKKEICNKVLRRLFPVGHRLNDWLRNTFPGNRLVRRFTTYTVAERLSAVVFEIRRLLVEALQDFPRGADDGEPLPCAHQAYIMNTLRRLLSMEFEETNNMPLKRLSQHLREVIHHRTGGKAMQLTEDEAAIWAEDLRLKTAVAQSPEAVKAEQDQIEANARRRMREIEG